MAQMDSSFIANPLLPEQDKNPLAIAQSAVGLQGNVLANQNASKTIRANQAMSQIVQQATRPDGTIDYAVLHQLAATNPDAAYNLQAATQAAASNQGTDIANQSAQLEQTHARLGEVAQRMVALYSDPATTPKDLQDSVGQAVKDGLISHDRALDVLDEMPTDPTKLHSYLGQQMRELSNAQQQLQMAGPQYLQHNFGNYTLYANTNPFAAPAIAQTAQLANGLSPSEQAQQVTALDAQGNPIATTLAQRLSQQGVNPATGQPAAGAGLELPGYDHPAGQPAGAVQLGPSQQTQQAWSAAMDRQQKREQEALSVRQRIGTLDQANTQLSGLSSSDWAGTGPKSRDISSAVATLNTLGFKVGSDAVNNRQQLVKYLENAINTSAQDAGFNGSNERLDAWKAGQPDPDKMGPQALKAALSFVRSQSVGQALQAEYVHNYASQNGPASVSEAEQNWNRNYDPNALYLATVPADQRQRILAKMDQAAPKSTPANELPSVTIRRNLSQMIQNGLLGPGGSGVARFGLSDPGE